MLSFSTFSSSYGISILFIYLFFFVKWICLNVDNSPCVSNFLILSNTEEHSVVVLKTITIDGTKDNLNVEKN